MEGRKLLSIALSFGISTLICLPLQAIELKSFGFDLGLSASIVYTGADDKQFGGGSGYQSSIFFTFDVGKDYFAKLQWDQVLTQQSLFNETMISPNVSLKEIEQRYHLLLLGIEKRYRTWFWEGFSGISLGRASKYIVKNNTSGTLSALEEETSSMLLIGGAIGYRMPYKSFIWIARAKTFSLLSNVYDKDLGEEDIYLVFPLMMSLGLEF